MLDTQLEMNPHKEILPFPEIVDIQNYITGETCSLNLVTSDTILTEQDRDRFKEILNQPKVYDTLYRHKLKGEPVSIHWSNGHLETLTIGFTYLIRDPKNRIVAHIGLKPSENNEIAVLSYIAADDYPGVMTNSVIKICEIAKKSGIKKISVDFLETNIASQKILERAGFTFLEGTKDHKERLFKDAEKTL